VPDLVRIVRAIDFREALAQEMHTAMAHAMRRQGSALPAKLDGSVVRFDELAAASLLGGPARRLIRVTFVTFFVTKNKS
jgi:hypothetical protein